MSEYEEYVCRFYPDSWGEKSITLFGVPIVRCRDCVFFTADVSTVDERGEQIATGNLCEWTELWTEPDGFCAWAERRTDDN